MKESEILVEKQDKVIELLEEILKWTRFDVIQRAKEVLLKTLEKDSEKIAYQYSDGRGSMEIAKIAGVSDFAIRSYWKKWTTIGLVQSSSKFKGRYERLFSLEDLGVEVPAIKAPVKEEPQVGEEVKSAGETSASESQRGV